MKALHKNSTFTFNREDRIIGRKSNSNRYKTAPEIKTEIEHHGNVSFRKKPSLTARHNKARLEFARACKEWAAEQWSGVIFSESRILHWSDGRVYVRQMAGEELKIDYPFSGKDFRPLQCAKISR